MGKIAIITGATGQDASHLSELLLSKIEYDRVIGLVRRSSTNTHGRLKNSLLEPRFELVEADLTDPSSIFGLVSKCQPDEYYNLAAQSHVGTSFDQPVHTFDVNANGVLYALEAIRKFSPETRFYQASTSEMFGSNFSENGGSGTLVIVDGEMQTYKFQDEQTPLSPNSPYAVAKVAAHNLVSLYRRSYNVHASAGVLFNHEGERRGENFVTRKITKYVARLYNHRNSLAGLRGGTEYETLKLGNLDAQRDWGYAPDYVEAMYLMLQQNI